MSTQRILGLALVAAAGLATFGGGAVATVPDDGTALLPEGTYRTRELTRDELIASGVAAGFEATDVEAFLGMGTTDSVVYGLRLADGVWDALFSLNGNFEDIGWHGTYEVVDGDTVIATDLHPASGECKITYDFALDGDQLTLDMIDDPCYPGDVGEQIAQTVIFETAPYILEEPAAADVTTGDAAPSTYTSTSFAIPFEVTPPDWVPPGTPPSTERPNFLTWESAEPERALRFFAPVRVIRPPDATEAEVPADYVDYLLSMSDFGATFEDTVETTVDGRPATIVTATAANTIDGSLGCEEPVAGECWGLIPDATLRMAVIDTDNGTLLVWQRDPLDAEAIDYESFDAMLASLHFLEGAAPVSEPAVSAASVPEIEGDRIPDGFYTKIATRADGEALGMEPALLDAVVGADGELPVTYEIAGDRWAHYVTNDAGIREIGDGGTATYDDAGRWVTVSESTGCPGCVISFEWTYDNGTLTLTNSEVDDLDFDFPEGDVLIGLLVSEGVYQLEQDTDTIPDGTYSRVATRADGEALGIDTSELDAMLGADGEIVVEFEIAGDRWTQYATNDAGIREIGDGGTASYDDAGRWVTVSESSGCPGCVITFEWTFEDGSLILSADDVVSSPEGDREISLGERFMTEGTYSLQQAGPSDTSAEGSEPVTLRFAGPGQDAPPQLAAFIVEVQELSGGTIEFEWLPAYGAAADPATGGYSNAEDTIVADLADSTIDIGWVGTRALDEFDAMLAPLLVDSHDLQQRVFEAGIPERMLADVDEPGLVGITVLPGPLRKLAGVEHPFTSPADFSGQTVASDNTPLAEATFTALGATIAPGREGLPLEEVDAILAHSGAITGNGYHTQADSVVANLNFWPRPLAILMSAESFQALTPEQQDALLTAGANAFGAAMDASRSEDLTPAAQLCDAPIEVIESSEAQLAEFLAALETVYDDLASDPRRAAYLDEIRALKDELGAPPDTLVCPA